MHASTHLIFFKLFAIKMVICTLMVFCVHVISHLLKCSACMSCSWA